MLVLIDTTAGKDAGVAIPAECSNLSNGGLYAIVPMGYGVAIGRRYAFQLAAGECGPESASRQLLSQQGEVIRAELLFGENWHADHVGIGVRLSGPCAGLVPTPMADQVSSVPPLGGRAMNLVRQLSFTKRRHRYTFRYLAGREEDVIDAIASMAADAKSGFDWFDAAVLSYHMGRWLE